MQDSEIVELYFERNERAVTESDLKYGKRLRQASFNILRDGYEAEECVNDTYFKAWNTIPPTRPSSLMAFLLRIARNLSLDRWRMRSALKRDGVTLPLEEISEIVSGYGDDEPSRREITSAINDFLRKESEIDRKIFIRRYFYLEPLVEISKSFSLSLSRVKSKLFRMRKRLRKILIEREVEL